MLTIKKDKVISTGYTVDRQRVVQLKNLMSHLSEYIESIDDDVTFADFMTLLIQAREEVDWIFGHSTGFAGFTPYLDEMLNSPEYAKYLNCELEPKYDDVEFLEVGWTCIIAQTGNMEFYPFFHGWGTYSEEDGGGEGAFAIDFSPMGSLVHLPLRINKKVDVWDDKEHKAIYTWQRSFTLFDMIHAILFEISFMGLPEDRYQKRADLDNMLEEIEAHRDGVIQSGAATFISLDTIIEELRNEGTQVHPTSPANTPDATETTTRSESKDD